MNIFSQPLLDAAFEQGPISNIADLKGMRDVVIQLHLQVTLHQMQEIWEHYSAKRDAQWMCVSSVQDIHDAVEEFIRDRLQLKNLE